MRTKHVVSNSNINLPLGPSVNNITQLLSRKRFNGLVIIMIEPSTSFSGHTHKIHYQLQAIASSFRLYFVSSIFYIIPGNWPTISPQQRPNRQNTATTLIQIGFIMTRHFFNALFNNETPEVPGTSNPIMGS